MQAFDRRTRRTADENGNCAEACGASTRSRSLASVMDREQRRPSPLPQVRAGTPPPKGGRITVTEADLKRCGTDLKMLRQCCVPAMPRTQQATTNESIKSFKDDFVAKCRGKADHRDPWKNMEIPDAARDDSFISHATVLDQVWVRAKSKNEPGKHGSTPGTQEQRATVCGSSSLHPSSCERRGEDNAVRRSAQRRATTQPPGLNLKFRSNENHSRSDSIESNPPRSEKTHGRDNTTRTTLPARAAAEIQSRIQPREVKVKDSLGRESSPYVQEAIRLQKCGLRVLEDNGTPSRYVWVVCDPESGEVRLYPRAAAERIEVAVKTGRQSVPLAGLDAASGFLEGSIVNLEQGGLEAVERNFNGSLRQMRCVEVSWDANELRVHVASEGGSWKLVDSNAAQAKLCVVKVSPTDMFRPMSAPSPSKQASRRDPNSRFLCMNPGAYAVACK